MQETTLVAPTLRFALHASETLRTALGLPSNADVARHLSIDPGHYSRVHRQRAELSAQLLGRVLVALEGSGHTTTDVLEIECEGGDVLQLDLSWRFASSAASRRLAS